MLIVTTAQPSKVNSTEYLNGTFPVRSCQARKTVRSPKVQRKIKLPSELERLTKSHQDKRQFNESKELLINSSNYLVLRSLDLENAEIGVFTKLGNKIVVQNRNSFLVINTDDRAAVKDKGIFKSFHSQNSVKLRERTM